MFLLCVKLVFFMCETVGSKGPLYFFQMESIHDASKGAQSAGYTESTGLRVLQQTIRGKLFFYCH